MPFPVSLWHFALSGNHLPALRSHKGDQGWDKLVHKAVTDTTSRMVVKKVAESWLG